MASEVVCGLVFRLLLPACLAAGELVDVHFRGPSSARGPAVGGVLPLLKRYRTTTC